MEIARLPTFIRDSTVLTTEEKKSLAAAGYIPDEHAVDSIRLLPEIRDLLQAFIGDESTRDTHLQLKAKTYLAIGDVAMAWKVLLL